MYEEFAGSQDRACFGTGDIKGLQRVPMDSVGEILDGVF